MSPARFCRDLRPGQTYMWVAEAKKCYQQFYNETWLLNIWWCGLAPSRSNETRAFKNVLYCALTWWGYQSPSSGTPAAQWRPKSSIPTFGKTLLLLKILKMRAFGVNFKQWWNFVVLIAFGSSNACKADQMSRSVKCESSLCKQLLSELSRPIVFLTGKVDKRSNSSTLNCKSNSALYSIAA